MKRNLILIVILGVLGFAAYLLVNKSKNESSLSVDRDFAITDMSKVGKIILADHKANKTTFEKDGNYWVVNGKYGVNERRFEVFEKTLQDIEIKYIPSQLENTTATKQMASYTNQIKIFDKGGKLMKSYLIGGTNADGNGTYMLMEGYKQVFVMHIAHMMGSVDSRYHANTEYWIAKDLFPFHEYQDLKTLSFDYLLEQSNSIKIDVESLTLTPLYPNESIDQTKLDKNVVKAFLTVLFDLKAGKLIANLQEFTKQDMKNNGADIHIKYTDKDGNEGEYFGYQTIRRNQKGDIVEGQPEHYAPRQLVPTFIFKGPNNFYYSISGLKLKDILRSIDYFYQK